jgi:hypothetical protein
MLRALRVPLREPECGAAARRKPLIGKAKAHFLARRYGRTRNAAENKAFVNKQSHRRKYFS